MVYRRKMDAYRNNRAAPEEQTFTHLVVLGGRDKKQDRSDRVEAFEPAPPLGALASHIHHLERHILDLKLVLVDPFGGPSGQEDVLLAGEVVLQVKKKKKAVTAYDGSSF